MGCNTLGQAPAQPNSRLRRYAVFALLALVMLYAVLAGLRTITDVDAGWQLASGRYIFQHRQIPATDVLSYTARGQEWIYPASSELLLYLAYIVGGFAALSWVNALACAASVGLAFCAEAGIASAVLAILAIPKIAYRTAPRADLFTTLLFAALLAVLWRHHRGRKTPLWLVPLIFVVWANTHLGFISGFALLIGYAVLELGEVLPPEHRAAARARLRSAIPWLMLAVSATLLNSWGWNVYRAVARQGQAMESQQTVLAEWRHVPLNAATLAQAIHFRNPDSGYFCLLVLSVVAAIVALRRAHFGAAVLLLGSAYLSVQAIRFQALFVIVEIVVAAPLFAGLLVVPEPVQVVQKSRAQRRRELSQKQRFGLPSLAQHAGACTLAALAVAVALLAIRSYDLVTEHAYLAAGDVNLFGAGLSSYYPQRAADFIRRENLPGNIFNEYNLGGFLSFELGPQYLDYIDPRAIPFGDLAAKQRELMRQSPDSSAWQEETDRRGINTAIFSLARYWGIPSGTLRQFCTSKNWTPVYLDDAAVVLVRTRAENFPWISRLAVDCQRIKFDSPPAIATDSSSRGRAELFNYYANAGSILFKLGRNREAEAAPDRAIQMFPQEPFLHQIRGQVYQANGNAQDAEREYLTSARLKPVEATTWYTLAMLYISQQRYTEAANAFEQAAQLSVHPSQYYISLGKLYVAMRQPQRALSAFDAAAASSNYEPPEMKARIRSEAAEGRARAWRAMSATP